MFIGKSLKIEVGASNLNSKNFGKTFEQKLKQITTMGHP